MSVAAQANMTIFLKYCLYVCKLTGFRDMSKTHREPVNTGNNSDTQFGRTIAGVTSGHWLCRHLICVTFSVILLDV